MAVAALPPTFLIVRDDLPVPASLAGAVVAIGNFDGVHLGHRAVIDAARKRARGLGRPAAALTFEPHPRSYFAPEQALFRLTPEPAKLRRFAAAGLDGAVVLAFDARLAAMTAADFVETILVRRLAVAGVAVGFDFHFGKDRVGSPEFLQREGARRGFAVDIVGPLLAGGRPASSSAVREALAHGEIEEATRLLGHPWSVVGEVVRGDQRGRTLGYPTANLRLPAECRLAHGIYAVRVMVDGIVYDAVASYGRRPTFGDGPPLLESFLFDFSGDLYGKTIEVAFHAWLRAEAKFPDAAALVQQMDADAATARARLAAL